MTRDDIKKIFPDCTDEQLQSVMDLNKSNVELIKKLKSDVSNLQNELDNSKSEAEKQKEKFDKLNSDFDSLKTQNSDIESLRAEFEKMKIERLESEKLKNDELSFNSALGNKKFSHDAIKNHYFNLFRQEISKEENKDKSAADILHNLTKDDKTAFSGITAIKLAGGNPRVVVGSGKYSSRDEIMKIKDTAERQAEIAANPQFFPELNLQD